MTYTIRGLASWLVRPSVRLAEPARNGNRFRSRVRLGNLEDRLPPGDVLSTLISSIGFASAERTVPDAIDDLTWDLSPTPSDESSAVRVDFGNREAPDGRAVVEPSSFAPRNWLGNPEVAPTVPSSTVRITSPQSEFATPLFLARTSAFALATPPQSAAAGSLATVRIDTAPIAALSTSEPVTANAAARHGQALPHVSTPLPLPPTPDANPAYVSRGTAHEMAIAPDRVAVRAEGGAEAISAIVGTNGLTVQRWITDAVAVLQGSAASGLSSSPGLTVVPVFVPKESGRDAIAFDQIIVRLQPGLTPEAVFGGDARVASYAPLSGTDDQFLVTTSVGAGSPTLAVSNALDADKRVVWAAPNFYQDWQKFYTPNDPVYPTQWHLNNTTQKGGVADADVDAPEAWDVTPGGSSSVVVAVIDDGMELTQPDLAPNLWVNPGEIAGDAIDNDGNGWVDDINGWDWTTNGTLGDNDPGADSTNDAHATSVSGVIAAKGDNALGVAGIAYQSRVLGSRIFGSTGGATTDANIASAIYYATGRTRDGTGKWSAASITNNSWGGGGASQAITDAFAWGGVNGRGGKGVPSFVATGNSGASLISFPASLSGTTAGVIAVGASTISDARASYSQFGPQIDFVAPSDGGTFGIVTTDRVAANGYNPGDYTVNGEFGGTSSATPLAAGTGALVLALAPGLTAEQVRLLMRNTTDLIGGASYDATTGFNGQYGRGRINAFAAVKSIGVPEISVATTTADLASGAGTVSPFGTIYVGQSSTTTYRIRNQGTTALTLSGLSASGTGFAISSPLGSGSLALGESTSFAVTFAPTAGGAATGAVSLTTNDANEGTFTFSLAGTALIPSVIGKTFEDWNGNGVLNANDPSLGGIKVFADANANGIYDRYSVLTTPNLAIPDNNPTGVSSTTTVAGQTLPLAGLTVTLNITHTFDADLILTLSAPNGATFTLADGVGGSGDNFTNTVFDDAAAVAIGSGAAPFTGSFRPATPFSTIAGISPNGVWTLKVADVAGLDTGTFVNWTLAFDQEVASASDANGNYVLPPLPDGKYNVLPAAPTGFASTSPGYPITIAGATPTFTGLDQGLGKNNRAYLRVINDQNADGVFQPTEPGLGGRFLYVDANTNGKYDPPGKSTFTSGPIAVPLLDNKTATNVISVSGFNQTATDVNVSVTLTHTWDADLALTLIGPTGTRVLLSNHRGGSGDNYTGTIFDDQAATKITAGTAPFNGSFQPEELLSKYNAAAADGLWTLEISDNSLADEGVLTNWTVSFVGSGDLQSTTSAANGNASIDLAAGAADVRLDPLAGWKFTNPADGKFALTAAGAPLFESRFGTAEAVAPTVASSKIDIGTAQRSLVRTVTITFSERVTFTGTPAAAVSIAKTGGGTVTPTATVDDTGAVTILTVGFADGTQFGSLLDGDYTLAIDKTQVRDIAQNPMAANYSTGFFRLFGDSDGDHDTDTVDLAAFRKTDGLVTGDAKFNPIFDFDSDGDIDTVDLARFRQRFFL